LFGQMVECIMDIGIKENNMVMDYLLKMELLREENGIWEKE